MLLLTVSALFAASGKAPYGAFREPERYLSTYTDEGGTRSWCVVGFGGLPECRTSPDMEAAILSFRRWDGKTPREAIPLWDGDGAVFTTLGAFEAAAARYGVDWKAAAERAEHIVRGGKILDRRPVHEWVEKARRKVWRKGDKVVRQAADAVGDAVTDVVQRFGGGSNLLMEAEGIRALLRGIQVRSWPARVVPLKTGYSTEAVLLRVSNDGSLEPIEEVLGRATDLANAKAARTGGRVFGVLRRDPLKATLGTSRTTDPWYEFFLLSDASGLPHLLHGQAGQYVLGEWGAEIPQRAVRPHGVF